MSELEWRACRHCEKKRYCSFEAMRDHEEDCPKRPAPYKLKLCPKCGSVLVRMQDEKGWWICLTDGCDFEIGILTGGKLQT